MSADLQIAPGLSGEAAGYEQRQESEDRPKPDPGARVRLAVSRVTSAGSGWQPKILSGGHLALRERP